MRKTRAISDITWDDFEKSIFTPDEIEASNLRVARISRSLLNQDTCDSEKKYDFVKNDENTEQR